MDAGRVEHRHRAVLGPHQQHDLGAAEYDRLRAAFNQARDHSAIGVAGCRHHPALHQLVVDHPVHGGTVIRAGHQHLKPESLEQPALVELLLHRECGAQQADAPEPGRHDPLRRRVRDVQQRDAHGGLHLVGHAVHGVGADQEEVRAAAFQPPGCVRQQRRRVVPAPRVLQRLDLAEFERPHQAPRRPQPAQPVPHGLVDDAVILGGTLPAHAADEADHLLHV